MGGYLVWAVLTFVALLGLVLVRYLPEKAQGNLKDDDADADEDEDDGTVR